MILSAASKKLALLPTRPPAFLEIMECSAVSKLPDGPQWVYEILCGPPHKISVALRLKADAEHDITVDGPELAAQAIRASLVDEFQTRSDASVRV